MKRTVLVLCSVAACALSQTSSTPSPAKDEIKVDTVVARSAAHAFTVGDIKAITDRMPDENKKTFLENPKTALQSYSFMDYLSQQGEAAKLGEMSPFKEQLALQRQQIMAQAMVAHHAQTVEVPAEEVRKKFDQEPQAWDEFKLRVILIACADPKVIPAKMEKKPLTEEEALEKAAGLVKDLRAGADFAELAKKESNDRSAGGGGEFGTFRRNARIPDEIANVVFKLKTGGITDPIRQGPGVWIVKVDELKVAKFEEVSSAILQSLKIEKHQAWFKELQKQFEITLERPEFFEPPKPAEPAVPAAPAAAEKK